MTTLRPNLRPTGSEQVRFKDSANTNNSDNAQSDDGISIASNDANKPKFGEFFSQVVAKGADWAKELSDASPWAASGASPNVGILSKGLRTAQTEFSDFSTASSMSVDERSQTIIDGAPPFLRDRVEGLLKSSSFTGLHPSVQGHLLNYFEDAGPAATYRERLGEFDTMINNENFPKLMPDVQRSLISEGIDGNIELAAQVGSDPGFAGVGGAAQRRLADLMFNQDSVLSQWAQDGMGSMMRSSGYQNASAAERVDWQKKFIEDQPAAGYRFAPGFLDVKPHSISEPTPVEDHAFRSGTADALRYDVTIGDKTIAVMAPVEVQEQIDGETGKLPSVERLAESLASLPSELLEHVDEINLNPSRNPDDGFWEGVYGEPREEGDDASAESFEQWAARYKYARLGPPATGGFRSFATASADKNKIDFYPFDRALGKNELASTLTHEIGHLYSLDEWGYDGAFETDEVVSEGWENWQSAMERDVWTPSQYGQNSPAEDFSESLELYWAVVGTSKEDDNRLIMPTRFALLDKMFPSLRANTNE
ncbi:MAG: hypothetical protein AAFN74_07530 [Myxococcota bacterium]